MMTSSPGLNSARNTDAVASVAPHATVSCVSGSTGMPYRRWYLSAIAWRSFFAPHVTAYWLMSPLIAAIAASFIAAGMGKSGMPCERLTAPYCWATRVISRMTDSENVWVRMAFGIVPGAGIEPARHSRGSGF